MRKVVARYWPLGIGGALGLLVFTALAVMLAQASLRRRISFFMKGTTDPLALVAENLPPGERISYGNQPEQFGELSLPSGGTNFPVAIVLHGGCWEARMSGAPPEANSLEIMRPLSAALVAQGIATWNIEYRRLGDRGGGWPRSYQDVAAAADSLAAIAAKKHLDLKHVIIIGHSSGGQLALWLAGRGNLPPSSPLYKPKPLPVVGVLDIDGPPDIGYFAALSRQVCGPNAIQRFMGGTIEEVPSHYADGSAEGLLPLGVPQQLLYSGKMELLPRDQAKWADLFSSYADAATKSGDRVQSARMDKAGHFDGIDPGSKSWPTVMSKVKELL